MGIHICQHSGTHVRGAARLVAAALIPALASSAGLFSSTAPAAAASGTEFAATAAPLSYGGNDYTALLDSAGAGSVYLPKGGSAMSVTVAGTAVPGIPGDSGAYDFDVALARFGDSYVTMYVEASMFEYYSGGPYWHSCSGFESLMAAVYGGSMTVACDNFAWNILESSGPYGDFTFTGYARFEKPGTVTAVTKYSDPALTYVGEPPSYYASATPLSFAGIDYSDTFDRGTKSPPAGHDHRL